MQKQPTDWFFKTGVMRNFAEFTKKTHLYGNLFFDKFKLCRSKICKNTFFAEHHGRLLLITAVSIVVKEELANKTVNYDTKTKAYVPIYVGSVVIKKGRPVERSSRSQTIN